jgi:hypothetical protein
MTFQDLDKRMGTRYLRVTDVTDTHAKCQLVLMGTGVPILSERHTVSIKLSRLLTPRLFKQAGF